MSEPAAAGEKRKSEEPLILRLGMMALAIWVGWMLVSRVFLRSHSPLVGKDAPDIALHFVANTPAEAPSTLSALKGKPVLLDFWATWCGPCQAQGPYVEQVARSHQQDGLTVIGVNTSDEMRNTKQWLLSNKVSYPIAFDQGGAAGAFGVENLPTLVVIGKDGKIAAVRTGITPVFELESLVKDVL